MFDNCIVVKYDWIRLGAEEVEVKQIMLIELRKQKFKQRSREVNTLLCVCVCVQDLTFALKGLATRLIALC